MEMTREMVATIAKQYKREQDYYYDGMKIDSLTGLLAEALLAEMDKPKIWDGAPEWATKAVVNWSAPTHYSGVYKEYTRELPKSRERQIAEEYFELEASIGFCELAILKAKAEWEAGR